MGSRPALYITKKGELDSQVIKWFFPGTQVASTTKTGRHDIAEISLKVALNTINQNQSNQIKLLEVERLHTHLMMNCWN